MITLPPLYHWAPKRCRWNIMRLGLKINSPNTISTEPMPYICLGTNPKTAWAHSVGTLIMAGKPTPSQSNEEWDLWQVTIGHSLPVHIQPEHGPFINEVRVTADIPPTRLWLCGTKQDGQ